VRTAIALLLCAPLLRAEAAPEAIRTGLLAPGREDREGAARAARAWARRDPLAVDALFDTLDARGRCLLVHALAAAGGPAAQVAARHAGDPEPEVFRALLQGLVEGGRKALFTPFPEGLPERRVRAVEGLRTQWRVEEELALLKNEHGPTGHYLGQYAGMKEIGPGAYDVLLDIVQDVERPIAGQGGAGPYRTAVPAMVRFEREELRTLAAYSFGELVSPEDEATKARLLTLYQRYAELDEDLHRVERRELAPALSFSLHDLGVAWPGRRLLRELAERAESRDWARRREAIWELGYAYMRLGDPGKGTQHYEAVLDMEDGDKGVTAYNLACAFAMRAMQEPRRRELFKRMALGYLQAAIERHRWIDWPWMEEDGDLEFIRDDPLYQELLAGLKARYPVREKRKVPKRVEEFLAEPKDAYEEPERD
jgi:hypothetical protein